MQRAWVTSDQGLRSYYMALFQLPLVPERLLLAGGGAPLRRSLLRGGLPEDAVDRYVARMRQRLGASSRSELLSQLRSLLGR